MDLTQAQAEKTKNTLSTRYIKHCHQTTNCFMDIKRHENAISYDMALGYYSENCDVGHLYNLATCHSWPPL
jgi:hypothetical protein